MKENSKDIQLQYEGFLKTPLLWKNNAIFELTQFEVSSNQTSQFNSFKKAEIRLGKRVEQFSFFMFQQNNAIEILSENIQIQDGTRTVGEIDCLLLKNKQPVHIEIVYKFYLYDKTVGTTEIEHWIGPNKRDSFHQKLTKLKQKQLPLLQSEFTKPYLKKHKITSKAISQNVYFKAQLFVPLAELNNTFPEINNDCIYGFYIFPSELEPFSNCKFHIPTKVDWLKEIQLTINWLSIDAFKEKIKPFLNQKSAPLCWIKYPNGKTQKFFIVWWKSIDS